MKSLYTIIFLSIVSLGFGQELTDYEKNILNLEQKSFYDTSVTFCHYMGGQNSRVFTESRKYTYDAQGNEVMIEYFGQVNELQAVVNTDYGLNNEVLTIKYFHIDIATNLLSLTPSYTDSMFYDNNLNLINETRYSMDSQGLLALDKTKDYTYDASNNLIAKVDQYINSGNLLKERVVEYTYDLNNLVIQKIDSVFNSGAPWLVYKNDNVYNTGGQLIEDVRYDQNTGSFAPTIRREYFYDVTGLNTVVIYHEFNSSNNSFELSGKVERTYDAAGNLIEALRFEVGANSQQFYFSNRASFSFDSDGNQIAFVSEEWNSFAPLAWSLCCAYELCGLSLNNEDVEFSNISMYPNPTSDIVNIKNLPVNAKVGIYNILGMNLLQAEVIDGFYQLDLNRLGEKGIYLIQVSDNNSQLVTTKKIILD